MRFVSFLSLLLCLIFAAPPCLGDAKLALEKFKQAQKAYDAKDYAQALELARAALEGTGSPNARLYVARALRELGQLPEAHGELERTLRDARDAAKTDAKYEPTRDAAAAELALLDQRVGKVIVALVDPPPGAKVELNGKALDATQIGQPVAVAPGDVLARAHGDGAVAVEKQIQIAAGATQTITLVFKEAAPAAVAPVAPEPSRDRGPPAKQGGSLRTVGYVLAGVGVAGIAVFAVTGSMASSKYGELEDACGSTRCTDPKYADTVDSGKRLETIANVGLIAGGVGLLGGGALILFGGPKEQKSSAGLRGTPGGMSFEYVRRF
ncbi:MAG: tetratricopeptide repeat protein [Polyangiaceae bacterium]|nr:tetratricopeptide repeat protein [Polyangiaceae bacterium]MCE7894906.1 tetratricopeptide repeat protein [Sorangiineae bacterium PRO1]MCL4755931.1 tetratricopeptide repeat protein [Myxococcales bacterium]